MNLTAWMGNIDTTRHIFELNLPGTHDCTARYVQLSHFARCQNKSIRQQLDIGIRALDIRVEPRDGRLKLIHGICKVFNSPNHFSKQMDMADVLSQCYAFLEENPSEAVVLQFKNDNNGNMEECFDILYNKYISANPDKWYLSGNSPELYEASGKLVLLRRCSIDNNSNYPLGTGIDISSWQEQDEIIPKPLELDTGKMLFVIQDRYKYKPEPRWNECIKPFLDNTSPFCGKHIINYISTAGGIKGPFLNARYINSQFMKYPLNYALYYGIIYADFPDEKMTEKIIKTNFGENYEA